MSSSFVRWCYLPPRLPPPPPEKPPPRLPPPEKPPPPPEKPPPRLPPLENPPEDEPRVDDEELRDGVLMRELERELVLLLLRDDEVED